MLKVEFLLSETPCRLVILIHGSLIKSKAVKLQVVESSWKPSAPPPSSTPSKRGRGRPSKKSMSASSDDDGVLPPPDVATTSRGRPIQAVNRLLNNP